MGNDPRPRGEHQREREPSPDELLREEDVTADDRLDEGDLSESERLPGDD